MTAVLCTDSVKGPGGGCPMTAERDGTSELTVINGEWERLGGIDEAGRESVS
jgi:hypothetical protein